MRLHLAGDLRELESDELEADVSPITGRPLRKVAVDFVAGETLVERVDSELKAAGRREPDPLRDDHGTSWSVGTWSSSYTDGDTSRRYHVELTEIEQLNVSRVRFIGFDLEVQHYFETEAYRGEGPRLLLAEVTLPEEETERIRPVMIERDYFDLVRVGISDEPIRVRFGNSVWQAIDDQPGARRFQLVFVTEEGDEDSPLGPDDPTPAAIARIALDERARLRALIAELAAVGVLPAAAVERIEEAGSGGWVADYLEVRQVSDVTEHRL